MRRICAWCGALISAAGVRSRPASHGLCSVCHGTLIAALRARGLEIAGRAARREA